MKPMALWGGLLLLAACSLNTTEAVKITHDAGRDAPVIEVSANDDRQYAYRELENGLRVVLVSDPKAPKSAASLDVFVGSGHDPSDRKGLAHFLEHMLFLGTDKYPQADEYQAFISAHGGSHNAYTSYEHTNYFFNIEHAALPEGLDRFAQFFIAPRFDAMYVEREKNAVNAEYQARIRDEGRRGLDVFLQVANPDHTFNRFSIGSLETLADREGRSVRDDLLAFYKRYYSASIMTLSVVSDRSLDELDALVDKTFSAVPKRPVDRTLAAEPLFKPGTLPLRVNLLPEQEVRELSLTFPVPELLPHYRTKPVDYITHLLGHEGEGSLLSWLKTQGWADSLLASSFSVTNAAAVSFDIGLTEQGLAHIDEIVEAVFQALAMIRNDGIDAWRYAEQARLSELSFRYMEKSPPDSVAMSVSNNLQYYPPQYVLRGDYLMESFPEALVRDYLGYLLPDNVLVMVTAKDLPVDQTTQWFNVPYGVESIKPGSLAAWRNASAAQALALPQPNAYLPEQLALVPEADADVPVQVDTGPGLDFRVLSDSRFGVPRGHARMALFNPAMSQTIDDAVKRELLASLLLEQLSEPLYPAWLAGIGYSVESFDRGIYLSVSGFADKQAEVLSVLVSEVSAMALDESGFDRIKDAYIRSAINSTRIMPFRRLVSGVQETLLPLQWSGEALAKAAERIRFSDVQAYGRQFLGNVTVDMLVYGNYDKAHWLGLMDRVKPLVTSTEEPGLYRPRGLEAGHRESLAMPVLHDDAAVLRYIAGESTSLRETALFALTGQLFQSDFFHQLRTEQQLGYVVYAGAYPVLQYPGMMFVVQSPTHDAQAITDAVDAFMSAALQQVDQADFDSHRASLIGRYREPPTNPQEMSSRLWDGLMLYQARFDRRERIADQLERMTFSDWQAFARRMVTGDSRREITLYAPGKQGTTLQ